MNLLESLKNIEMRRREKICKRYIFLSPAINRNPFESKMERTHFARKSFKFLQNRWLYQNDEYSTYGWFWVFLDALGHFGHHYNHIRTHSEWNNRCFRQFATGRVRMWSTLFTSLFASLKLHWYQISVFVAIWSRCVKFSGFPKRFIRMGDTSK